MSLYVQMLQSGRGASGLERQPATQPAFHYFSYSALPRLEAEWLFVDTMGYCQSKIQVLHVFRGQGRTKEGQGHQGRSAEGQGGSRSIREAPKRSCFLPLSYLSPLDVWVELEEQRETLIISQGGPMAGF